MLPAAPKSCETEKVLVALTGRTGPVAVIEGEPSDFVPRNTNPAPEEPRLEIERLSSVSSDEVGNDRLRIAPGMALTGGM